MNRKEYDIVYYMACDMVDELAKKLSQMGIEPIMFLFSYVLINLRDELRKEYGENIDEEIVLLALREMIRKK